MQRCFPRRRCNCVSCTWCENSLGYVSWKERKTVARDLRTIYNAATEEQAEQRLAEFQATWDAKYPPIGKLWRRHWAGVIPPFGFPQEIHRAIYTTNIIESLHMTLRKVIRPGHRFRAKRRR